MQLLLTAFKTIYQDIILNVLYFPVWWYSRGTAKFFRYIMAEISDFAKGLNIGVLFKYLFKPMYGYADFWSRVISFLVRTVHFLVLLIITVIWTLFLLALFLIWLLAPIFVLYNFLLVLKIIDVNIYHLI